MIKVVCIKNCSPIFSFSNKITLDINIICYASPIFSFGDIWRICLNEDSLEYEYYYKDNFILFSKWREQQINKILND